MRKCALTAKVQIICEVPFVFNSFLGHVDENDYLYTRIFKLFL